MKIPIPYREAMETEFTRAGVTDYHFESGGKHPRVVFVHEGRSRFYVFPTTPSDRRGILNMRADLRKMLGLLPPEKPKSPRPVRQQIRRETAPEPTEFAGCRDPFAVLAAWKPAVKSRATWERVGPKQWRVDFGRNVG